MNKAKVVEEEVHRQLNGSKQWELAILVKSGVSFLRGFYAPLHFDGGSIIIHHNTMGTRQPFSPTVLLAMCFLTLKYAPTASATTSVEISIHQ